MRIHVNEPTVTALTISRAARAAGAVATRVDEYGSKSHARAYDVLLEGNHVRRPNGGPSGYGTGYAATWDEWGDFLAALFELDPTIKAGRYNGRDDFNRQTANQYNPNAIL